ncbi:MAG TPA: hypothetical protein VFZ11_01470 [Gemmatimonadaceae bacterium]
MNSTLGRAGRIAGSSIGAAALLGLGYAARTWLRYGHAARDGAGDASLDRFMREYEIVERHSVRIRAPAELAWAAARRLDLQRSPIVRAVFRGRELLMRGARSEPAPREPFVDTVLRLGWRILDETPERELVFGAVTRPWDAEPRFVGLPPGELVAFDERGYVKIVWNLAVDPIGPTSSRFRSETRVATTDAEARRRFRSYWTMVEPGVRLIRIETLRLVKCDAERRVRAAATGDAVAPMQPAGAPPGA